MQWNGICMPLPCNVSSQCVFGRHSWRLRRHFRHVARKVSLRQDRALSSPSAGFPSPFLDDTPPIIPSAVEMFLSSFNPAVAGIHMLTLERMERLRFQHVRHFPTVNMSLRSCRDSPVSSAVDGFVFPAMMEMVLHSVGGFDSFPLIVDLGA